MEIDYTVLNKNIGTIITVVTTLFIFSLGQLINWIFKKIDKKRKLESTKSIVEIWCRSIEPTFKEQIKECYSYKNFIKDLDSIQVYSFLQYDLLIDKINGIDFKEFAETFVLNLKGDKTEKIDLLFDLIANLNLLSAYSANLYNINNEYNNRTLVIMEEYNTGIMKFWNTYSKYSQLILDKSTNHPSQDFYLKLTKIVLNCKENNFQSLKDIHDNMITPIQNIYKEITLESKDVMGYEYIFILADLIHIIDKWNLLKNSIIKTLDSHINSGQSSFKKLKESIDKYEKMKLKSIFFIK